YYSLCVNDLVGGMKIVMEACCQMKPTGLEMMKTEMVLETLSKIHKYSKGLGWVDTGLD
ncbi:hypothetical protein Tco_0936033, partial [Tanacetum coccineum]